MPYRLDNISFSLLDRLTDDLLCTRCLRLGVRRRITQVVSCHHRPLTLCRECAPDSPRTPRRNVYRMTG